MPSKIVRFLLPIGGITHGSRSPVNIRDRACSAGFPGAATLTCWLWVGREPGGFLRSPIRVCGPRPGRASHVCSQSFWHRRREQMRIHSTRWIRGVHKILGISVVWRWSSVERIACCQRNRTCSWVTPVVHGWRCWGTAGLAFQAPQRTVTVTFRSRAGEVASIEDPIGGGDWQQ